MLRMTEGPVTRQRARKMAEEAVWELVHEYQKELMDFRTKDLMWKISLLSLTSLVNSIVLIDHLYEHKWTNAIFQYLSQ